MRAPWLEPHTEFEGVGAHELNPRYDPVDEQQAGYAIQDTDPLLMHTPALIAARSLLATGPRLDGPDISHYQYDAGPVSLAATKAAPTSWFGYKLTQSTGYLDPTADRSRTQAFALDYRCSCAYHWLSSTTDPEKQAAWYLSKLGVLRESEAAMLDDEEAGVTVDKTLGWLEAVERVTKRPCAVYTGAYVAGGTIWQSTRIRESKYGPRPMILAAYTSEAKAKALPGVAAYPWSSWQYSSSGPVPGITGRCDMNRVDDWAVYDRAAARTAAPAPAHDPVEDDMPAIMTNAEDYTLDGTSYGPGIIKWELVNGCKMHLSGAYWNALGAPSGNPRPSDEIAAIPDYVQPSSGGAAVAAPARFDISLTGFAQA